MKKIYDLCKGHKIVKILVIGAVVIVVCVGFSLILSNIPAMNVVEAFAGKETVVEGAKFITKEKVIEGASFIFK